MPIARAPLRALLLALSACSPAGAPASPAPSAPATKPSGKRASALVFDEIGKDLGAVVWPGGSDTRYTFRNTGEKPVAITDVLPSCGCTNPRLRIVKDGKVVREGHLRGESAGPMLRVAPGESGELEVRFETATLQGNVRDHVSRIAIATDERVDPIDLFLKAQIERLFDIVPSVAAFDPMGAKQTQTKEVKILVFSPSVEPPFDAKILATPNGLRADVLETTDGVRPVIWLGLTAGPGLPKDGLQGQVMLEARFGKGNAKETRPIKIPVVVPVVADVYLRPSMLDFQMVEESKPARSVPVVLDLLDPDRAYRLGEPRIEGEQAERLRVEIEPITEGHKYRITLAAPNGLPAATATGHHGLVRIPTGLSDFPEVRLPYRAYTRASPPKK